jgi:cytochrome c553
MQLRRRQAQCDTEAPTERMGETCGWPAAAALATVGLFLLGTDRAAAAEDRRGAQLAAMCASCHRLDGRDQGIPSIVGLKEKALLDAMAAFRSGERPSRIMHAVAISLSEEEIVTLAEYIAALEKGSP